MNTTRNPTDHRDDELGAALRALDVPEHTAAFHRELRRRLADEPGAVRRRFHPGWKITFGAAAAVAAAVTAAAVEVSRAGRAPRNNPALFALAAAACAAPSATGTWPRNRISSPTRC